MVKNIKDAKKVLNKINKLEEQLKKLTPDVIYTEIKDKWSQIQAKSSQKDLQEIPVEVLDLIADDVLPIEKLIQSGIKDVHSALKIEKANDPVFKVAKRFSSAYRAHSFPPLIQSDTPQKELTKQLIGYDKEIENLLSFKKDSLQFLSTYNDELMTVIDNDTNAFFRLFQNKEKKAEIKQAKQYISKNEDEITAIELRLEEDNIQSMPDSLAADKFLENKETYYKKIEELTDYQPQEMIVNLPYYLKDKISEFEIFFQKHLKKPWMGLSEISGKKSKNHCFKKSCQICQLVY